MRMRRAGQPRGSTSRARPWRDRIAVGEFRGWVQVHRVGKSVRGDTAVGLRRHRGRDVRNDVQLVVEPPRLSNTFCMSSLSTSASISPDPRFQDPGTRGNAAPATWPGAGRRAIAGAPARCGREQSEHAQPDATNGEFLNAQRDTSTYHRMAAGLLRCSSGMILEQPDTQTIRTVSRMRSISAQNHSVG